MEENAVFSSSWSNLPSLPASIRGRPPASGSRARCGKRPRLRGVSPRPPGNRAAAVSSRASVLAGARRRFAIAKTRAASAMGEITALGDVEAVALRAVQFQHQAAEERQRRQMRQRVVGQQRNRRLVIAQLEQDVILQLPAESTHRRRAADRSKNSRRAYRSWPSGLRMVSLYNRFHSESGMLGRAPSGQYQPAPARPKAWNQRRRLAGQRREIDAVLGLEASSASS